MAYPPNIPQYSRWIHQRGHSSLRSSSCTIQPSWTVLPVSGPSIVTADNDPNWEDAPANPSTNNNIANRPTFSTCSQSKLHWSNNNNKQLAEVLSQLANTLNSNQTSGPNTPRVDFSSKLASNSKLTSDKHKKYLKNNLYLYCGAGDHKQDSCPKKQTTISLKGRGASATANTLVAASEKPLEK